MTNYQAVSKSQHQTNKWKRYSNYLFAANDTVAEISTEEIDRAAILYPLAFIKTDSGFRLAVVLGLEPGKNIFVDRQGMWSVDYVPALYRAYPFTLMTAEGSDQLVVCVDADSGLLDSSSGEDFFAANGEASAPLNKVIEFLLASQKGLQRTRQICDHLDRHGLIEPWPLKIQFKSDVRTISDLYRISTSRLGELSPEELVAIRNTGGLKLAYSQIISIQNMYSLGKLLEQSSIAAAKSNQDFDLGFFHDEGSINFDNFD